MEGAKLGRESEELVQNKTACKFFLGQPSGNTTQTGLWQSLTGDSEGLDMRQSHAADEEIRAAQLKFSCF